MIAQDPTNHIGKIIRIHLDGSIPNDNPKFDDKPEWLPEIYQLGVRNPQGLTLSNFDQKIYAVIMVQWVGIGLEKLRKVKTMAGKF